MAQWFLLKPQLAFGTLWPHFQEFLDLYLEKDIREADLAAKRIKNSRNFVKLLKEARAQNLSEAEMELVAEWVGLNQKHTIKLIESGAITDMKLVYGPMDSRTEKQHNKNKEADNV